MIYQLQYRNDPDEYVTIRLELSFRGTVIRSYIATEEMAKVLAHFAKNILSGEGDQKEKLNIYLQSLTYSHEDKNVVLFDDFYRLIFAHKNYRDFIEAFEQGLVFCLTKETILDTTQKDSPFVNDCVGILKDLCTKACHTHLLVNVLDPNEAIKTLSFYHIKPEVMLDQTCIQHWIEHIEHLTSEIPLAVWRNGQLTWLKDRYVH